MGSEVDRGGLVVGYFFVPMPLHHEIKGNEGYVSMHTLRIDLHRPIHLSTPRRRRAIRIRSLRDGRGATSATGPLVK